MGQDRKQSKVKDNGGLTPTWVGEKFVFRIANALSEMIEVEVWDKNTLKADSMIGQGVIPISQVINVPGLQNAQLTYKGKSTGVLSLEVKYHPDGAPKE